MIIKSIYSDQVEILRAILTLHVKSDSFDLDPTYSKGVFYKDIKEPKFKFDVIPQKGDVKQADCRHLPFLDEEISSIMFDPPFLATKGPSLKKKDGFANKTVNRFGCYDTEKELFQFYQDSLREFHRILVPKGVLAFKCQDKVSSGKQYWSHVEIHNMAKSMGFYPKDLFVLEAKNRLTPEWQANNQKHARKFHCYFWVFEKK